MRNPVGSARPERLGQSQRAERTRALLISAAEDSLVEDGVAATTLASVAERVGVTTGAVQRHFGTKSGLLLAVFDDIASRQLTAIQALAAAQQGGTLRERVREALLAAWRGLDLEAVRVSAQLAEAARTDPALRTAIGEHAALANEQIGAAIADSLGHRAGSSVHFATATKLMTMVLMNLASAVPTDENAVEVLLTEIADLIAAALQAGKRTRS